MSVLCRGVVARFVLPMTVAIAVDAGCAAQKSPTASAPTEPKALQTDPIEALAGAWDHRCSEKGCLMLTNVLIGDPDHPSDPEHPEYITIGVAINRVDRKPAYFEFDLPPDADRSQGVLISFVKTQRAGDGWKMIPDADGWSQLDFNECDSDSCTARVHPQILGPDGTPSIDLLDKFLKMDQIYFVFTRKGEPYRALKALFPFQRDYKEFMETELKPGTP